MPTLSKPFEGNYPVTANRGYYTVNGKKLWHGGIDFGLPTGTPVYAIEDGEVVWSQWDNTGGGEMILIRADSDGGQTLFCHLSQRLVNVGQKVKRAEQIGLSGNTGNSTGPHLHFEFWKDIDPALAGIIATDEMANNNLPAEFSPDWAEPSFFNNLMSKENAIGQVRDTVLISNQNRKQAIINAINGDDWNYTVWELLNETREKQDEITRKNTLLEETRKELRECQNQTPCEAGVVETLQKKDKEVEELKKQLQEKPQVVSSEELAQDIIEKIEEKFKVNASSFLPKSENIKWLLGIIKNNSTVITTFFVGYGFLNQDQASQIISWVVAGLSFLLSVYLEYDKTKYQSKEKLNQ